MEKTLHCGALSIAVSPHGAELTSLRLGTREYLWGGDAKYWKRHSPVLFPIVGSLWQGECRHQGLSYRMGQHGLARDLDFTLLSESDSEVWFRLDATDATLARYPFRFRLDIGYRLTGRTVRVMWRVSNLGTETMPFQIGAHPAFHWPLLTDADIAGGTEAMERRLATTARRGSFRLDTTAQTLTAAQIGDGGCVMEGVSREFVLDNGTLPLTTETFAHDALILEGGQTHAVTLCGDDGQASLTVRFPGAPLVGLWSPPGKNAPFVCIEPWYGRADNVGFKGTFAEKPWTQTLELNATFEAWYEITVE